jgi:hypothetical protein
MIFLRSRRALALSGVSQQDSIMLRTRAKRLYTGMNVATRVKML